VALAFARRTPEPVPLVLLTVVAAEAIASGLKGVFDRDRPPSRYPEPEPLVSVPHTHAFPSGHATTGFACAVVLGSLAPRLRAPLLVLAALVAWSRVYVGVHYPLDVVAGAFLGVAIGLGATALRRRGGGLRRSPRSPRRG
jgi:undecaprenyl-diphosphatase